METPFEQFQSGLRTENSLLNKLVILLFFISFLELLATFVLKGFQLNN